ncbi:MAG: ABC transporter ATP-binding protein [Burkholderiaceae bacterium]|jgi:branched-chain amino acid transport system ATP-binding protein
MSLLRVEHVTKRFGGLIANEDISFDVEPGQVVGLIGPNGAGKTTLFNCIAGYAVPTSGSIWLGAKRLSGSSPEACARLGVGRTFQIARTFGSMTAVENVMVAAILKNHGLAGARARSRQCLDFVGLARLADIPAASLTISEQRRLAVARALAIEPAVLLLDEVMAGLNPSEVKEAVDVVLKIRDRGVACLVVEHVLEGIMPIADRIVVLDYGRKLAEGPPGEVANNPLVVAAYLGA